MFTGIVEALGTIAHSEPMAKGQRLRIDTTMDLSDARLGDSIAVDGCCLTVTGLPGGAFTVDLSQETLDCTAGFAVGARVNLEKALRFGDRLGGHLVSGHIDGVGEVTRFDAVGENRLLAVRVPPTLRRYLARKGSITINGVSLTVNEVQALEVAAGGRDPSWAAEFHVNLIPHTLAQTNLQWLRAGARVNLEADLLARYIESLLAAGVQPPLAQ